MAAPRPIKRTFTGTVEPPPLAGGPPPARDPRMERAIAPDTPAWTLVVVPQGGTGAIREYALTTSQLRRLRWVIVSGVVVAIGLVLTLGVTFPRSMAYGGLLEENLALKMHLQQIDDRMTEVDRMLLRLRLYDAQLKSLTTPKGDHGPLDIDAYANHRLEHGTEGLGQDDGLGPPMEGDLPMSLFPPTHSDLRPVESWAMGVTDRMDTFLSLFTMAEGDLNRLVGELEDLAALERALPSFWPAKGARTSGYGWRRNPFGHRSWKFHSGLDVANKRGTPIHAAGNGRVVRANYNSGYGRMVEIDHGYGITTLYAHCTTLYVKQGDEVEAGTLIGTMGTTGRSTGPHLHFEVRLDGHPVDPMDYLP